MPSWKSLYKTRRATKILSHSVRLIQSALELMGEECYLLKMMNRADAPEVQRKNRRVPTLTKTLSSFEADPDTGNLRGLVWDETVDPSEEYPDQGVFTVTVSTSGGTTVYDQAPDKYMLISGYEQFAFDEYRDEINDVGNPLPHQVYVVFNTPPFHITNSVLCTFGYANPLTNFSGMQPIRDNQEDFHKSLFGYEQWLNPAARVRRRIVPNAFLLCFPSINYDITFTDSGLLQDSRIRHFANCPPYAPEIAETDIVVRKTTGQRYQVVNLTKVYIENILVQQAFDMVEIDPRSETYNITVQTT